MDYDFSEPLDERPLQSVPPNPEPLVEEPIDVGEEEEVSDGFLEDSDATESEDRSERGPSTTATTTSTEHATSIGSEQDADAAEEVEQAILAEIGVARSDDSNPSDKASGSGKKKVPSCPYLHYFTNGEAGYNKFLEKYDIPEGVIVTLIPKGMLPSYGPNHLIVPLMAITEGGVRFPMNNFIRAVLNTYSLSPDQLTINSYRVINSAYELKVRDNLELRVWDLFELYAMSRNAKFGRYFLMTRPKKRQIVDRLPDSDHFQDICVMVSGDYCLPITEDPFPVPTLRGDRS